jgi:hypothetical protein
MSGTSSLTVSGVPGRSTLLCASPRAGVFRFTGATNVTVSGLTLDYDTPPFSQGTVTSIDATGAVIDWTSDPGYPPPDPELMSHKWGVVIDRKTAAFKLGTASHIPVREMTAQGNGRWRFQLSRVADLKGVAPGDAFVMRNGGEGHAICLVNVQGALIQDVTVQAAASLAVAIVGCDGDLVVERMKVRRRPGSDRLVSANADGIHCQRVRGRLRVEGCSFEGMTDDGMNTYDQVRFVTDIRSPVELRVNRTFDTRPGDRLQILNPHTGLVRGEAGVLSVSNRWVLLDTPIAGVRTSSNLLTGIISMTNHLDADVVFNLNTCGAGYVIRSNHFGPFRGRGLILRGVGATIEGNTFERTSGPGIVIANEPRWPEGPMPRDVVIRGNQLTEVGLDTQAPHHGAITVTGLGLDGGTSEPVLRNVRIENNTITEPPGAGIVLHGCDGVRLEHNRITATHAQPWNASHAIRLAASRNVAVSDLDVNTSRPGFTNAIAVGANVTGLTVTNVQLRVKP